MKFLTWTAAVMLLTLSASALADDVEILNLSSGDQVNQDKFTIVAKGSGFQAGDEIIVQVKLVNQSTGTVSTDEILLTAKGPITLKPASNSAAEDYRLQLIEEELLFLLQVISDSEESGEPVKICHVPPGNHEESTVLELLPSAVRAHLTHGGESYDYLLPGDSTLEPGDWCDPYAGI